MEKFTTHTGVPVPLRRSNVDTDQIIPAVYLKRVTRSGFEDGLFAAWRKDPDFELKRPGGGGGMKHQLTPLTALVMVLAGGGRAQQPPPPANQTMDCAADPRLPDSDQFAEALAAHGAADPEHTADLVQAVVFSGSRMIEDGMSERRARALVRDLLGPYLA